MTGVDFSEVAIAEARKLSRDLGIHATFEVRGLSALQSEFREGFDMVFTSHGVLTWLSDLRVWAEQLAGCLRPGGNFYISEGHPLVWAFADELPVDDGGLRLGHSYLSQPKPSNFVESTGATRTVKLRLKSIRQLNGLGVSGQMWSML